MNYDVEAEALIYFRPPKNYFWQWAEKGEVIEWKGGPTICFRDELMLILSGLASQDKSIPSLGTLLLVLAASQDNWEGSRGGKEALTLFGAELRGSAGIKVEELDRQMKVLFKGMNMIYSLPRELRSGSQKTHLAHEIFSATHNPVVADLARLILDEFGSGRLDAHVLRVGEDLAGKQFLADSSRFILALSAYRNQHQLQMKLKTGLSDLPQPAEILLSEGTDLLEILSEDPKTERIARITQRLLAVLNFPMHSQGTGDQSFGGVSDITNRGNFDRLLLSELANDEILLTARLVNQEALYLRREEPPAHPDLPRTILMDTTLKMWGLPRVFAISAALACSRPKKQTDVYAYSLGGKDFQTLGLTSREGVIQALEQLDAGLHCGDSLMKFLNTPRKNQASQIILIVGEEWAESGRLWPVLTNSLQSIQFLLIVSRSGELQFYELIKESRKLISSCRLDLDELLTVSAKTNRISILDSTLPAFLRQVPAPLYCPTTGMNLKNKIYYYEKSLGMVGITDIQRVLYWPSRNTGAREVLPFIDSGTYCFGFDGESKFFITVHDSNKPFFLKFYRFDTKEDGVEEIDFSRQMEKVWSCVYHEKSFYLSSSTGKASIDCISGKLTHLQNSEPVAKIIRERTGPLIGLPEVKQLINNGYTVLQRISRIYVTGFGELSLNHHRLELIDNTIRFSEDRKEVGGSKFAKVDPDVALPENAMVRLRKAVWSDGSEAVVDSRGFLHLRSANASIPEITLVLIVGKPSAGWASDGSRFGSSYFVGTETSQSMRGATFYSKYIQTFIDHLS